MAVMNLFQLTSVMSPLQGMLDTFLDALPKIVGAGLVFFVGFVFAKIARELTVTACRPSARTVSARSWAAPPRRPTR